MIRRAQRRPVSDIWRLITTFRTLKQVHAVMIVQGFNTSPYHLGELIFAAAITVSGSLSYACQLFQQIPHPDIFTWNAIIRGSSQSSNPSKAISLYTQMEARRTLPDKFTFPFLLKACTKLSWVFVGEKFHAKIVKYGFQTDTFVRNSLINLHANCGDLKAVNKLFGDSSEMDVVTWSTLTSAYARRGELTLARELFDNSTVKDLVSWNVMISLYAKRGHMKSARELFDKIPQRDIVSWNAMIAGYSTCGSLAVALQLFEEMRCSGEQPDEVTLLSLLSASADSGSLEVGRKMHRFLTEVGSPCLTILLGNALIDMYSKCGKIEDALEVFEGMKERDVSTWNTIIGGTAFHGHGGKAVELFDEMMRQKLRPNEVTFVGVLVGCSHVGMVEQGRQYFSMMGAKYGIDPNIKHYGCMVDMLSRAGFLEEAFDFVYSMGIQPNDIIWRTLLRACWLHGNIKLGERANKHLLQMRRDHSGDYVLLSNIYASVDEWGGVENVRKLMDDRGVRKEAGFSLLEEDAKKMIPDR